VGSRVLSDAQANAIRKVRDLVEASGASPSSTRDEPEAAKPASHETVDAARRAMWAFGSTTTIGGLLSIGALSILGFSVIPGIIIAVPAITCMAASLVMPEPSRRTYHAMFAIMATAAIVGIVMANDMMANQGPFDAFPGIKLAALAIALLAPSRRIGVALIGLAMLAPIGETYLWWSAEQRSRMPLFEPWATVGICAAALALLSAQRHRAEIVREVAQAQADRDGMARLARLVLALRDLANSPMQTLVLSVELLQRKYQEGEVSAVADEVERLNELIRALPPLETIDVPDSFELSFDARDQMETEVQQIADAIETHATAPAHTHD
jgi:hypothetical protein